MTRLDCLAGCALALALAAPGAAQTVAAPPPSPQASAPLANSGLERTRPENDPALAPPTAPAPAPAQPSASASADDQQITFSADTLDYDSKADIVTAAGDVRMFRQGDKLRADKVVWQRKTGKVTATGNVAVVNPQGDTAYGDSVDLTDSLKGGVVENMLVVLEKGGRIAAREGTRQDDGTINLRTATYSPCAVVDGSNCPKEPTWKITAVRVTYRPERGRIYYRGAALHLFGLPALPLPSLSNPVGGTSSSGLLSPDIRYSGINGLEAAIPYFFRLAPNSELTLTPHIFTTSLPMMEASYAHLSDVGAYQITAYGTVSRRSDDLITGITGTEESFRGYLDGLATFQLSPDWTVSGSLRVTTDKTFLRRYDLSYDDRLRSTFNIEHIDENSYFSVQGWAVQTLRVDDAQGQQPIALPLIDYRRRFEDVLGGRIEVEANTLALTRPEGQDTQRAFASARWDLSRITPWGQVVTFTLYGRADAYNTHDVLATDVASYQGLEGFQDRGVATAAIDVQWPLIGALGSGTQRLTPQVQLVLSPRIKNLEIPDEDSRAIDLDDTNLFALNRFPGYDRVEDSSRITYGLDYAVNLPGISVDASAGQSYAFVSPTDGIFFPGTGLSGQVSDIVGRVEVRWRDFISFTDRYRLDHDSLAFRKNEIDLTIGTRENYAMLGYLRLDRNIVDVGEDLENSEELRAAARFKIKRFWSTFGSAVIDLTNRAEDPLHLANGFQPIRTRLGVQYEDDCLRLGMTWKRDYADTGDARRGNSFILTLSFKNLGR